MSVRLIIGLSCTLVAAGCGSSLKPGDPSGPGADHDLSFNGDGGGGRTDAGPVTMIDMAGYNMAGSPEITILSPAPTDEVPGDSLAVTAKIKSPSNTLISADTVAITITPPGGGIISRPLYITGTPDVYAGTIELTDLASGDSSFFVSAEDINGLKGSAEGKYIHDHGPDIRFYNPTGAALKGTVNVEFTVEDRLHPITNITQVKAGIRGVSDIPLQQVAGAIPFRAVATVDATKFTPPLDGKQIITARATNEKGTERKETREFNVDNTGPAITVSKPSAGSYAGGVTSIEVTIDDGDPMLVAGVNPLSVKAVFAGDSKTYSIPLARTPDLPAVKTYIGTFDVRALGTSFVSPILSIRADDLLGNHSEYAHPLIVDNTRPFLTMNSAWQMHMGRFKADKVECSQPFSPIGDDAAQEGAVVQQIFTVRARIEDRGNWAPGLKVVRYSGLSLDDPPTMYVIPSTGVPLAVDSDGDGACDDVNPTLVPTTAVTMSGEALAVRLDPLAQAGDVYWGDTPATPKPAACDLMGEAGAPIPKLYCPLAGSLLTYVIPWPDEPDMNFASPIFSIRPVTGGNTGCIGFQLDSLNSLPEGPACLIARASDITGNVNVSYPLHVCIDRGGGKCTNFTPAATDCTGVWDKTQQKIVPGTCSEGATFPHDGSEVRLLPAP